MKLNPTRYTSAIGDVWVMATFKVKYCHKIFDNQHVREFVQFLLETALDKYHIRCSKMAFDSDHVHLIIEMGLYRKPEIAKLLRGFIAKHLFQAMPWVKNKYFWGSGLWNPAYDIRGISDIQVYNRYLDKQKYANKGQRTLLVF